MNLNEGEYQEIDSPLKMINNKIETLKAKKDGMVKLLKKILHQYEGNMSGIDREEQIMLIKNQIECLEKRFQLQYKELVKLKNKYSDDSDDLQKYTDELKNLRENLDELEKSLKDLADLLKSLLNEFKIKKESLKALLNSLPLSNKLSNALDDCIPELEIIRKEIVSKKSEREDVEKMKFGKEGKMDEVEEEIGEEQEVHEIDEELVEEEEEEEEEEETDSGSFSSSEDEREDTSCIQELGRLLKYALAEVNMVRPSDPIHYIEKWLRSYVKASKKISDDLDNDNKLRFVRKQIIRNIK